MQLSQNFTLEELTNSPTAKQLGLSNTPDEAARSNLKHLVTHLLQPLRTAYKKPIHINSGYRSAELNQAVGGIPTSQHRYGQAADCQSDNPTQLLSLLLERGLDFDQAILYPTFLHLSLKQRGLNRKQVLRK